MVSQTTATHETTYRGAFRRMDGGQFQQIRVAYYKAVEGLQALAKMLTAD